MAERFGSLLGTWTGLEKLDASPWGPATTARASLVLRLDVEATVVVEDYRQVRADGGELTGHGVYLVEPGTDRLLWWFFDSDAQVPIPAAGRGLDGELVLERTTASGTTRHRLRADGDRLDHSITVRLDGSGEHVPVLTGTYRRLTGH